MTQDEKLDLILAELAEVKTQMTAIGSKMLLIDTRTADTLNSVSELKIEIARTNAGMEQVRAEVIEIKSLVRRIDSVFTQFTRELMEVKSAQGDLDRRMVTLENTQ